MASFSFTVQDASSFIWPVLGLLSGVGGKRQSLLGSLITFRLYVRCVASGTFIGTGSIGGHLFMILGGEE